MHRNTHQLIVFVTLAACIAGCSRDPEATKRKYLASGTKYMQEQKYKEAIVQLRSAVKVDPKFGEARYQLAEAYARAGDAGGAYREYLRAADLLPANVDAQVKAGGMLLLAG